MHALLHSVPPTLQQSESEVTQSCPTLCDSMDCSPPDSSVHGILQARVLEWVAISFSNAWKWKVKVKSFSRVQLLATPWTVAYQAPLSIGFSRQEYWSGVPLPSPFAHQSNTWFPPIQSLLWGSFHKLLILIHQRADRMKTTITEN